MFFLTVLIEKKFFFIKNNITPEDKIIKLTKKLIFVKKWTIVIKNEMNIKPKKKLSKKFVWLLIPISWPYPTDEITVKVEKIKKNIDSKIII